jgi:cathepsin L
MRSVIVIVILRPRQSDKLCLPLAQIHIVGMLYIRIAAFSLCGSISFAALLTVGDLPSSDEFNEFIKTHKRSYTHGSAEYQFRHALFQSRVEEISQQNSQTGRLWTAGVNEFTDRTDKELATRLGYRKMFSRSSSSLGGAAMLEVEEHVVSSRPANKVDWRFLRSTNVTADQQSCGSCWAFAAIAMLQARLEIAGETFPSFSVQQIVSCVENPHECGGSGQCGGATVELAIEYMMNNKLVYETDEPYEASSGMCDTSWGDTGSAVSISALGKLPKNNYSALFAAVNDGPVAISVDGSDWFSYRSGIFTGCSKFTINHAVVLFGYGTDKKGTPYWLIKNSWGSTWGETGFGRFIRKKSYSASDCGIDHKPGDGTACKPYPDQDTACGCNGMFYDSVAVQIPKKA